MIWIIVAVVLIGIIWLRQAAHTDELRRQEFIKNQLDNYKSRIIKHHNDTINKYSGNMRMIGLNRDETKEKIIEWQTEIEKIKLWDKHRKTILASNLYSSESKNNLDDAWFYYIGAYSRMVQGMEYGVGDPFEEIKQVLDLMETFLDELETFGYDGEKEQKEIYKNFMEEYKHKKSK